MVISAVLQGFRAIDTGMHVTTSVRGLEREINIPSSMSVETLPVRKRERREWDELTRRIHVAVRTLLERPWLRYIRSTA